MTLTQSIWTGQRHPERGGFWLGAFWSSQRLAPIWTPARIGSRLLYWSDQLDLRTLYQDSAGTTPVTSPGDPVGMVLDKRLGMGLGTENWVSGNLTNQGNWTNNNGDYTKTSAGWSSLTCDNLQADKVYEVVFTLDSASAGAISLYRKSATLNNEIVLTASTPGTYSAKVAMVVPPSTEAWNKKLWFDGDTFTGTIIDISIREIAGNHATQSGDARMTWQSGMLVDDGVDDSMRVPLPAIAAATVAIARPTGAEITYPVDLSAGSYTLDGDSYGWVIIDSELTADEQTQLTKWMNARAGL